MRVTLVFFPVSLLAAIAMTEEQEAPVSREGIGVLAALEVPRVVRQHLPQILDQGIPIPVEVMLLDEAGAPRRGRVSLRTNGGERFLETDKDGKARFHLGKGMLSSARIVTPPGTTVRLRLPHGSVRVRSAVLGSNEAPETLKLEDFQRIASRGLEVFSPPDRRQEAMDEIALLAEVRGFLEGRYGIRLCSAFGVLLHDRGLRPVVIEGRTLLPFPLQHGGSSTEAPPFHWIRIHEWVELSLVGKNLFYAEDSRTRFVGDGLAEYLSFAWCRCHRPLEARRRLREYLRRIEGLLDAGKEWYNLGEAFRAVVALDTGGATPSLPPRPTDTVLAGYPTAFSFWANLADRAGEGAVGEFIRWIQSSESRNLNVDTILDRLEKLTGSRPALTVDLDRARTRIEALIEKLPRDPTPKKENQ